MNFSLNLQNLAPTVAFDAVIFDCDGTLSDIEGVDEMARVKGVGAQVAQITAKAMGQTGISPEMFAERLDLVLPTAAEVDELANTYYQHATPDIAEVVKLLQRLGKTVYIVSAGSYPAVLGFGAMLNVPAANVYAVGMSFDDNGNYLDFDRNSPMVFSDGKRKIIQQLKQAHPRIVFVGDGLNDIAAKDIPTRFVGYGGAYYRENIQKMCEFYITAHTMTPLLPLCLTVGEMSRLTQAELGLYEKGVELYK